MSIVQNPVTGKMAKSFANVNTYVHRGQNVVSAKAFNRKDSNTEAQQAQRGAFRLISGVARQLGSFLESGFPSRPEKLSAYNLFMRENIPLAIDVTDGAPSIDYRKLIVSKGSLINVNVTSAIVSRAVLTVDFMSNIAFENVHADDTLYLLVGVSNGGLYATKSVRGNEATGSVGLPVPNVESTDIVFAYLFVVSADGKRSSNSAFVEIA